MENHLEDVKMKVKETEYGNLSFKETPMGGNSKAFDEDQEDIVS